MSRLLKIVGLCILMVVLQTTIGWRLSTHMVVPDLIVVMLTLLVDYSGIWSAFCAGGFMALLYDASVGSLLGINLVTCAVLGMAAVYFYPGFDKWLRALKHRHVLSLMLVCVFVTLLREIISMGTLFLTGSDWQNIAWISRPLQIALINAIMVAIGYLPLRSLMAWHPLDELSAWFAARRERKDQKRRQKQQEKAAARQRSFGKSSSAVRR